MGHCIVRYYTLLLYTNAKIYNIKVYALDYVAMLLYSFEGSVSYQRYMHTKDKVQQ